MSKFYLIRLNSLTLSIISFALFLVLAFFAGSTILLSPSHPFVDENGNGINDFDEKIGKYEDPAIRAKIYGVNFPIADLGSCGSYYECRSFCEDPVNSEVCISYGKAQGFYKDDPVISEKDKILAEAKKRLGCDSYESCLNFCEIPANYDSCHSFARSQGIVGGVIDDPVKAPILEKAKEILGCSSENECRSICSDEANKEKCSNFAKQAGLRGGEQRVGPGGCTSESTCRSFCSDPANFQVCQGFSEVAGQSFSGPGGCNSEESCRNFCQQNPADCGYKPGQSPGIGAGPVEMCNRTPNCAWAGDHCQCGNYGETKEAISPTGSPGTSPYPGYQDPAAACQRYGCTWSNNSCQCANIGYQGGSPSPFPSYSPYPNPSYSPYPSYSPSSSYSPYPSASPWSSSSPYPSYSPYSSPVTSSSPQPSYSPAPSSSPESSSPPPSSSPAPQPSSEPSSYPSPSPYTQGVSTQKSFWQLLQEFFFQL